MPREQYAAFISYSHRYETWARTLQANLERCLVHAGRPGKVFLDDLDLGSGHSWVGDLQSGIDRADSLILIATPEALASPRVTDEWGSFIATRSDWLDGHLHIAMLLDTPLPPFLEQVHRVDFVQHDYEKYRRGLQQLLAGLLDHADRRALPDLVPDVEVPQAPAPGLPPALRSALITWLAPLLETRVYRGTVERALQLKTNTLKHLPVDCAASAAIVWYTGDEDPRTAALRIVDTLADEFAEDEPQHVAEHEPLRQQLQALGPRGGLLEIYLGSVASDHESLPRPFETEQIDRVYVQLDLRPEIVEKARGERVATRLDRLLDIEDLLALDPLEHTWVTRRWVVRGDPGAGKTTMLRHLCGLLARKTAPNWIPVFESLPRLLREGGFLLERIRKRLERAGHPAEGLPGALDAAGRDGRLLILLDGLDEVPREHFRDAEELLGDLSRRWEKTPIVVSSRPIGYRRPPGGFVEADVLPFERERRREFLARWKGRATGVEDYAWADRALATLEPDPGLWELSGNPLYLTLMALLLEQDRPPERNRTRLYDQVFDLLLERPYRSERHPIQAQDHVRAALRYLADSMTRDNLDAEPRERLEDRLLRREADRLRDELERVSRWRSGGMTTFLRDVADLTGILGEHDGADADWRFWHRTFREALTAEALEERYRAGGVQAIAQHIESSAAGVSAGRGVLSLKQLLDSKRAASPASIADALAAKAAALHLDGFEATELRELYRRGSHAGILEHVEEIAGDESRWAEPYALLAGRIEEPDALVRTLVGQNRALGLRALATAQGLADETIAEVLELSDDWKQRAKVFQSVPDLVGEAERALRLLDRLRHPYRNGNDLFFIDAAVADIARRWPDDAAAAASLRRRLHDHIPTPPEALFREVDTPHGGRVDLWCEIEPGTFRMGSPAMEGDKDERETRDMVIAAPFRIGAIPVTNAQYAAFDDRHQPRISRVAPAEDVTQHPVVDVTWYEAVSFCRWLSACMPELGGARLPREDEWEHACRAGTTKRYWSGATEKDLARVGWYESNSGGRTHRVGEKPPNPWGLYDVHGNVWEWNSTLYRPYPYQVDDGREEVEAEGFRVLRGGSWFDNADYARAAFRRNVRPGFRSDGFGFRVVCSSPISQ